jgi:signal transduction histidine kinase
MIFFLSLSFVLVGLLVQLVTLASLRKLLAMFPAGSMRRKWFAITGLVFIFIAGYSSYIAVLWSQPPEWHALIISAVFLFGALFVWLTIGLSLQTVVYLRRMEAELVHQEKLALLGQIADTVGHELHNPLGVINNAVYFLQAVLVDADETTREYLGIIKNETADAERIVSDLLDAVRTDPPRPDRVEVAALIGKALDKCDVPSAVAVRLDIPESLPALRVDPSQMHQVLWNLITNGVEAMPDGGKLEIGASENPGAKTVTLSIRDSGSGIKPEHQARLFQPMFTTKARRVGLGLVVVKNLTQANGGSVKVESEVGKGTRVTVTLPIANQGSI